MTMRAKSSLVVALLAACHHTPDLNEALAKVRTEQHLPALGIMVWRHGQVVAQAVTGVRKDGSPTPATLGDQWHLGSDTKAMTATLVGIYVDRGALHWDDTLGKIFAGETIDPDVAKVTLDQLLEHRGGFSHSPPHDAAMAGRSELVRAVLAAKPDHAIGKFEYSNTSYVLLGAAIEHASGQSWEQAIHDGLFAPLAMASCGFGAPTGDQPWGHGLMGPVEPGPEADNPPSIGPAGTVHCSLPDWGKFLVTQASGKVPGMTDATFAHLHTPPTVDFDHYIGGWRIEARNGDVAYAHEGSNTRWHAIAIVVPGKDEAVAIVANRYDRDLLSAMKPLIEPYL